MHGVAPHVCGQVAGPLLGGGAGGRSPGFLFFGDGVLATARSQFIQFQINNQANKKRRLAEE